MLRDNLVELIEPMLNSAGANPLALTHHQIQASGDRLPCLENPRPNGAESSLTENVTSPFQAEPAQLRLADTGATRHSRSRARSHTDGRTRSLSVRRARTQVQIAASLPSSITLLAFHGVPSSLHALTTG